MTFGKINLFTNKGSDCHHCVRLTFMLLSAVWEGLQFESSVHPDHHLRTVGQSVNEVCMANF